MSLRDAPIGYVPIVWNNADLLDLAPETAATIVLDEMARLGYAGTQFGRGFPEGEELRATLAERGLRYAELYSALDASPDGLAADARDVAHRDLDRLVAAGGEVLVVAIDGGGERDAWSGRVSEGAPRWPASAYDELADLLADLANVAPVGVKVAFHPHTATWIEAPDEVDELASRLVDTGAGLCLDVGHYLVGGGDPVDAHPPPRPDRQPRAPQGRRPGRPRPTPGASRSTGSRTRSASGSSPSSATAPSTCAASSTSWPASASTAGSWSSRTHRGWRPAKRQRSDTASSTSRCARWSDEGRRHRRRQHGWHARRPAGRHGRG